MKQLEIHIHEKGPRGYKVGMRLFENGGTRDFGPGFLPAENVSSCPIGDPMAAGLGLRDWLLQDDELRTGWLIAREAPRCRVRLWIEQGAAELHALPWEMLPIGATVVAAMADTPFCRYLPSQESWGRPVMKGKLRVLVVISNPDDLRRYNLTPVNVKRERTALEEALPTRGLSQLDVDFLEAPVTLERLEAQLRERRYHVVHYLGHGKFSSGHSQAALCLQDAAGNTHVTKDTEILQLFENLKKDDHCPRLVFLNACEGAKTSTTDAFRGLGQQLVLTGIPAVVAMQEKISMQSARELSTTFYRRLLKHGIVDQAMNEARATLMMAGRSDVAVPVLFMRLQDGKLFNFFFIRLALSLIAILLLILLVVGLLQVSWRFMPLAPLSGNRFNIAIAELTVGPSQRRVSPTSEDMTYYLRDTLRHAVSELGYSPEQVDIVVYPGIGAKEKRVDILLDKVTRDLPDDIVTLLVYGYESEQGSYTVYFYLRNLQEAFEVGDEFLARPPGEGREATVIAQSKVLASFSMGLVELYSDGDDEAFYRAKEYFEIGVAEAEAAELEVALDTLYFFQGRVLAALGQPDAARSAYNTALEYNPDYAMAHIGLGNLIYSEQQGVYYAGEEFSCANLEPALAEYRAALESQGHYATWVEGKAHVMIGSVYLWCGQVKGDVAQLNQAVTAYDQALSAYKRDDARTEYLAMVYYDRGLAYEQLGYRASLADEKADAVQWYNQAIEEYAWCSDDDNAGIRTELAQDCSKAEVRVEESLGEVGE
jgi:tetratricopeptide (TPR) repeat protein